MNKHQLARMEEAVDRKVERSKVTAEEQPSLIEHGRPQDVRDPRRKSSGKGKKTADKWNQ